MKIAYLGPLGTFSSMAADKLKTNEKFKEAQLIPCREMEDVLYKTSQGLFDYGIVPIENSIEGSVNTSIDILLNEVDLHIIYELILNIKHNLVASVGLLRPEKIFSHPQALAQCRNFLKDNYPGIEKVPAASTLQSLESLLAQPERSLALVPNIPQGMEDIRLIKEDIGDYKFNQTRFYLLAKKPEKPDKIIKSSVCFQLSDDRPGGLLEIMELFRDRNINLTKIESRPAKHQLGRYIFIIDCQENLSHPDKAEILDEIRKRSSKTKLLGAFGRI